MDAPSRVTIAAEGPGAVTSEAEWHLPALWEDVPELDLDVGRLDRVLVVAAHPGDEALGAGGLIAQADARHIDIHVVLLTAGEASHPDSPTHSARMLASIRQAEFRDGLAELAPIATTTFVGLADGQVGAGRDLVVEVLVDLIGMQGESTLVVAPWRHDGLADHAAAGGSAAVAARRTDAQLLEYPVRLWHRGTPATAPWQQFQQLVLLPHVRARKSAAIAHHCSQSRPLSASVGDETVMDDAFLRHFEREREVFVVSKTPEPPEDGRGLERAEPTPWAASAPRYQRHAEAVTLASLPREHFSGALVLGCSLGDLAAGLARRCGRLVAVDARAPAVTAAQAALVGSERAQARRLTFPDEWPSGQFDLVVLSESGYTLSPRALRETVARIRDCLSDDGVLALGHWRHRTPGWPLSGDAVHDLVLDRAGLHVVAQHRERDLIVDVLSRRADGEPLGGW